MVWRLSSIFGIPIGVRVGIEQREFYRGDVIHSNSSTSWNPQLRRSLNDWEMDKVAALMAELEEVRMGIWGSEDRRI